MNNYDFLSSAFSYNIMFLRFCFAAVVPSTFWTDLAL